MLEHLSLVNRVIKRLCGEHRHEREVKSESESLDEPVGDLCEVCCRVNFRSIFNSKWRKSREVSLLYHSFNGSNGCAFCKMISYYLPQSQLNRSQIEQPRGQLRITVWAKDGEMHILYGGRRQAPVRKMEAKYYMLREEGQFLACVKTFPNNSETSTYQWASVVNYSLIQSWLTECETHHGESCNLRDFATSRYRFPTDLFLIDTFRGCLVKGESDMRYAALSYVWGRVQMLTTTTVNIEALQQPGVLSARQDALPRVVQDSLQLCKKLGERYLWVDCLCIEQDSAQKHDDFARMDVIYTHAHFVIVAVEGQDANAALPRVRRALIPPTRPITRICGQRVTLKPLALDALLTTTPYDTRGWTLQEKTLSRRRLYISEEQIYFECNVSTRSESDPKGEKHRLALMQRINQLRIRGRLGFVPELSESIDATYMKRYWTEGLPIYQLLAETYARRSLSYPQDIVNAFRGFASVFTECCGGIFLNNLPSSVLSAALLWSASGLLSRRLDFEGHSFPSWSWAGWMGSITYHDMSSNESLIPSESLNLWLEKLEIFVEEPPTSYIAKRGRAAEQFLESDVGVIQDCSLQDSRYIPLRSLASLSQYHRKIPEADVPSVDTLAFRAPRASPWRVSYVSVKTEKVSTGMAHICSDDRKTKYGVLFGLSQDDMIHLNRQNPSYSLIAVSSDPEIKVRTEFEKDYNIKVPLLQEKNRYSIGVINVMVVEKMGLFSERRAVGKIFNEYWPAVQADNIEVLLI